MISIIEKYIIEGLIVALLVLGGYTAWLKVETLSQKSQISALNKAVSDRDSAIQDLGKNAKVTDALVQTFQDSLKDLQAKELARQKAVELALAQANLASKEYESYSAQLLASTPKSSNICKEADDLINSYLDHERAVK